MKRCGTPPDAPGEFSCELRDSLGRRASGTYVSISGRLYLLTAGHVSLPRTSDEVDLRRLYRTNLSSLDLMAISVPAIPDGKRALGLDPRHRPPDGDVETWTMVRCIGGVRYATALSSAPGADSCCDQPEVGLWTERPEERTAVQTAGWCMEGGDSGATVLRGAAFVGVAFASKAKQVKFAYADLSTVVDGRLLVDILRVGPDQAWRNAAGEAGWKRITKVARPA